MSNWIKEFNVAITVCDENGIITEMNDKAAKTFMKDGGKALIGKSMFGCHPDGANEKIKKIMHNKTPNVYTIEKNGVRKMIYQSPWYENGEYKGLVELSLEIPLELPHFIRG
jgi:transcriptional regulator with PAS, ATPase and Fis domain